MQRVYMSNIPGQRRIHIEINEGEIPDLLDDIQDFDAWPATLDLIEILKETYAVFKDREDT